MAVERTGGEKTITFPYVWVEGEMYVGLGEQSDFGGKILVVPEISFAEERTHFEVPVIRKTGIWPFRKEQRVGYEPFELEVQELEGDPIVGRDSTVYRLFKIEFSDKVVADVNEGEDGEGVEDMVYAFNKEELRPSSAEAIEIQRCKFYHWKIAMKSKDMVTVASIGRLIMEEVVPNLEEEASSSPTIYMPMPIIIPPSR